ncbi:MAG: TlpA family protein disulfide reductase [Myxococcales bacterium]|nr:TlpA family protein disulfide reductase [Myxococcales bacterium]
MTLLLIAALWAPSALLDTTGPVKVGDPAPWFAGWTARDQVFNRTRLLATPGVRGHVIVFFATWCKPCEDGLKQLAAARPRIEAAGLTVTLVDYGEEASVGAPWLGARGLGDVRTLYDRYGTVAFAFGVEHRADGGARRARLPRTVVLDAAGTVRRIVGREGEDYVERLIDALPAPATPAAKPDATPSP